MIDGHLTSDDAAARLGIARQTLYNLAQTRDDFPEPLRIGRTLLWPIAGLDAWREQHPARRKPGRDSPAT
ncbi:helix-turn-helix domain-containing protein [Verrucosispora sp. WMMC514]|uniref:helix-turn-helix transcriptional regulator n=1 Tax=Verrucosispora sp. WMMC514 TaxID=3015156 RepID=UPI00248D0DE6|nr:helix-turn-helix domain-containing protein [Verrucosispora sp. WMMC514]WBB94173.1 helix-turn-helix domain-containing protein [Verrucosispora sp. WMMC514]